MKKLLKLWCSSGIIISFLFLPFGVCADSISDAVSIALETHPDILSLNYGSAAIRNMVQQSYSGYLPHLDLRASCGYENSDNPATRARSSDDEDLKPSELQFVFSQNLFDGFRTKASVASAKEHLRFNTSVALESAEILALQSVQAYLNVLQYQDIVRLSQKNIVAHESLLALVKQRVEQEVGSRSEVNQALARIKAAEADLLRYEGNLTDARAAYKSIIGAEPDNLAEPEIPRNSLSSKLEENTEIALSDNPAIAQIKANIARAKAEVNVRKAAFYPKIDLEFSIDHDRNISGIPGPNESASAMVVFTQNLFSGGLDRYRKAEGINLLKQAMTRRQKVEREITEQIKIAYNAWKIAKQRSKKFNGQVEENKKVREAFFQQYTIGKRTLLDLLDAENELFVSKSSSTMENYQEMLAVYRILSAQGRLLKTLNVKPPEGAIYREVTLF